MIDNLGSVMIDNSGRDRAMAEMCERAVALAAQQMYQDALTPYVVKKRARTRCAHCNAPVTGKGKQPIIWHHPNDDGVNGQRVGDMVMQCAPVHKIDAEIARCVPLCGSC